MPLYEIFGIAAPLKHLEAIFPYLHEKPLEIQAEYADVICKQLAADIEYHHESLDISDEEHERNFNQWNSTSIGNAAYMALYAVDTDKRSGYIRLLQKYRNWRRREFLCGVSTIVFCVSGVLLILGMFPFPLSP